LRIGVIADTHVVVDDRAAEAVSWHNPFRLADSLERLERAIDHSFVRDADVVVVLGDLAHFGDRPSLRAVVDAFASCAYPVVLLSGNHDVTEPEVRLDDVVCEVGAPNVWSPGKATVPAALVALFADAGLGLQVVDVTAMWPEPTRPFAVAARTVIAVPPGSPGLTLTHFPLLDFQERCEGAGFLYSGHLEQLAARPDLEGGWRPHVVFNGHVHARAVTRVEHTLQISFAALVEAPYEIAAVEVQADGGALDVSYECASLHDVEEEKVPVLDPEQGDLRCE
jgi:Calcineurin-like phosphoesterase